MGAGPSPEHLAARPIQTRTGQVQGSALEDLQGSGAGAPSTEGAEGGAELCRRRLHGALHVGRPHPVPRQRGPTPSTAATSAACASRTTRGARAGRVLRPVRRQEKKARRAMTFTDGPIRDLNKNDRQALSAHLLKLRDRFQASAEGVEGVMRAPRWSTHPDCPVL